MNYYPNDEEALKKIIEKYEAISFDIWDTLIARTVLQPEDVFSIVENRAKQMEIEVLDFRMHRHEAVQILISVKYMMHCKRQPIFLTAQRKP